METIFSKDRQNRQQLKISVPRESYISSVLVELVRQLDGENPIDIYYRETNSMRAISNIIEADYDMGIIRYQTAFEQQFMTLLHDKGLKMRELWGFKCLATVSKSSPLASNKEIELEQLHDLIQIAHGDPYVPSMPMAEVKRVELSGQSDKRILVFDRASRFELLSSLDNTYMWLPPIPADVLNKHGIVQISCKAYDKRYKEILIYKKDYRITGLASRFVEQLIKAGERLFLKENI